MIVHLMSNVFNHGDICQARNKPIKLQYISSDGIFVEKWGTTI